MFHDWVKIVNLILSIQSILDVVGDVCGFLVVVIAVILLNAFKDMDVSVDDVRSQMRPKRKLISMNGSMRGSTSNNHFEEALVTRQNYGTSSSESDRNV